MPLVCDSSCRIVMLRAYGKSGIQRDSRDESDSRPSSTSRSTAAATNVLVTLPASNAVSRVTWRTGRRLALPATPVHSPSAVSMAAETPGTPLSRASWTMASSRSSRPA